MGKRKRQRYPDGTLLQQRYSADQRYSVGKGSSRGTPTGPCCNRGTLRTRGTLWEKEEAEVPRRDPLQTRGTLWGKEVGEVPEVPCWELLKNLELSKSEIFSFMAENNLTHQTGLTRTKRVEKEKEYSQRDE